MAIVLFQGVRKRGWTSAKNCRGTRPSRAIARNTRGALSIMTSSTDVMPATPAAAMMNSAQGKPAFLKASDTPAFRPAGRSGTMPVSTATTAM